MPHDRRTARVLLATMGLVGVAVTAGCMRPATLRSSAGSVPELSPAGELHPVAGEANPGTSPTTAVSPATSWARNPDQPVSRPAPAPVPSPAPPAANPSPAGSTGTAAQPEATDAADPPVPTGPPPATPMTTPTPLLDAEIRRAQAVTRQQIESLQAADTPTPPVDPIATPPDQPEPSPSPAPAAAGPRPAEPGVETIAPLPLAATPRAAIEPEPAGSPVGIVVPPLIPIEPSGAGSERPAAVTPTPSPTADTPAPPSNPAATLADVREPEPRAQEPPPPRSESVAPDEAAAIARKDAEGPATAGPAPARDDREAKPALEIAALRLCSGVKDFGDVQPMNPDRVRPGRDVLVYCEMAGLEWEPCDRGFVWRLAAHLELRSGTDGRIVWEQAMGTAKYESPRRRHDNFVSYRVLWPAHLEPGTYRLRLIQTDLVANRTTSSEIPVTLVR